MNFWQKLFEEGPVIGMSPMDGVTDAPMRYMTAKYGKPKVIFTEFISVDGLTHAKQPESVDRLMSAFIRAKDVGPLEYKPYEVAQVFGHTPEYFYQAAVIVASLGYDGMDINMGCPAHKVEEHGSGAGLIRTPEIAKEIVRQAKRGIADWAIGKVSIDDLEVSEAVKSWVRDHMPKDIKKEEIPVSAKTRIGVDKDVAEWWVEELMEANPAVISIHGRTLKQMYQGSADWEAIARAAKKVHEKGWRLLGNGDVSSLADGMDKVKKYGVDGFLIGRASEGNPAVFEGVDEPSWEKRKAWILEHAKLYEQVFGKEHFVPMRKHLAWYCKGIPGASEKRVELVRTSSSQEVAAVI